MIKKLVKKVVKAATSVVTGVVGAAVDVASTVVNVVAETGKALVKTVKSAVQTVEKVVNQVGKAVESIGRLVQPLVERYAIQIALRAVLPPGVSDIVIASMSAGLYTMSKGGSPEDAIKSAALTVAIDKVGTSVAKAATDAGYSATEVAAARSAAQSAVATAATGGNIEEALKSAAIGATSSAAGASVAQSTQNVRLAVFTQTAVASALRGQNVEQAILQGASQATVSYLIQINEEQRKADKIVADRDAMYTNYTNKVNEYNKLIDEYNASTDQATVDSLKSQLDVKLEEINNLSVNIGAMNKQLADMQGIVDNLTKKAADEQKKLEGDFGAKVTADVAASEQNLIAALQDEFGTANDAVEFERQVSAANLEASDILRGVRDEVAVLPVAAWAVSGTLHAAGIAALLFLQNRAKELFPNDSAMQIKFIQASPVAQKAIVDTKLEFKQDLDPKTNLPTVVLTARADTLPEVTELLKTSDQLVQIKPIKDDAKQYSDEIFKALVDEMSAQAQKEGQATPEPAPEAADPVQRVLNEAQKKIDDNLLSQEFANTLINDANTKILLYTDVRDRANNDINRLNEVLQKAQKASNEVTSPDRKKEADAVINEIKKDIADAQKTVKDAQFEIDDATAEKNGTQQELNRLKGAARGLTETDDKYLVKDASGKFVPIDKTNMAIATAVGQMLGGRVPPDLRFDYNRNNKIDANDLAAALRGDKPPSAPQPKSWTYQEPQITRPTKPPPEAPQPIITEPTGPSMPPPTPPAPPAPVGPEQPAPVSPEQPPTPEQPTNPTEEELAAEREALILLELENQQREAAAAEEARQEQARLAAQEAQAIATGRAERQTAAKQLRDAQEKAAFDKEFADFEKELADLERTVQTAQSNAERARARERFVFGQRERLAQGGRLTGTLQGQIQEELGRLLDEYESAKEEATSAATRREGLVAPQQKDAGREVTDEDVIRLLGLSGPEAARYGFQGTGAGGGGATTGEGGLAGEGGGEAGAEEGAVGEGEGAGAGTEGEGEGDITGGGGTPTTPTTIRPATIGRQRVVGETSLGAGVSPRVTGEGLAGILGEKEPLFGGDEDEQRAVWNRRSLRLRRALGL